MWQNFYVLKHAATSVSFLLEIDNKYQGNAHIINKQNIKVPTTKQIGGELMKNCCLSVFSFKSIPGIVGIRDERTQNPPFIMHSARSLIEKIAHANRNCVGDACSPKPKPACKLPLYLLFII